MKRLIWLTALVLVLSLCCPFSLSRAQSTPTQIPTPVTTPQTQVITVLRNANLRAGPGTTFAVVGRARTGDKFTVVGQNAAGDWLELADGKWIAAFLVRIETSPTPAAPPTGQATPVTNIVDGDTIDVLINGQTYRVRYILVNTPERGELFYAEATEANRRLVAGKTVYLVKDVSETDRYGRLLRYVYLADGTFVNAELVRQGFAQLATFPPDVAKENEIRAAQQEAVAAGRGLWANSTAPVSATGVVVSSPTPTPIPPTAIAPTATSALPPQRDNCDPSYPTVCIPPYPPDLDCGDIPHRRFQVLPPDPHRFDRDKDGIGCESG